MAADLWRTPRPAEDGNGLGAEPGEGPRNREGDAIEAASLPLAATTSSTIRRARAAASVTIRSATTTIAALHALAVNFSPARRFDERYRFAHCFRPLAPSAAEKLPDQATAGQRGRASDGQSEIGWRARDRTGSAEPAIARSREISAMRLSSRIATSPGSRFALAERSAACRPPCHLSGRARRARRSRRRSSPACWRGCRAACAARSSPEDVDPAGGPLTD